MPDKSALIRQFVYWDKYISHHLSIDLSPLHSKSSKEVDSHVATNLDDVVEHTLRFAAEVSRHVEGRCAVRYGYSEIFRTPIHEAV